MQAAKSDIITRLRKEILPLEGIRSSLPYSESDLGLGPMQEAFPNQCFPLGAVHEFINDTEEQSVASIGFISGILSALMKTGGVVIWIGAVENIFPPAFKSFGIEPDRVVFVDLKKTKEQLWAMEEALKCSGLAGVVCDISEFSFSESRRFQLAVETSGVTGFILRNQPKNVVANSCVSRWRINPLPTISPDGMPGLGFPRWKVALEKIRNGKPGSWEIEWKKNKFHFISEINDDILELSKRKTG